MPFSWSAPPSQTRRGDTPTPRGRLGWITRFVHSCCGVNIKPWRISCTCPSVTEECFKHATLELHTLGSLKLETNGLRLNTSGFGFWLFLYYGCVCGLWAVVCRSLVVVVV